VVNIGNGKTVRLMDFITAIEKAIGIEAVKNFKDIQPGDVPATWANANLLQQLTGEQPETPVEVGIQAFVDWYRDYYGV
jgi:UDP-glucuronate 4-epimerase